MLHVEYTDQFDPSTLAFTLFVGRSLNDEERDQLERLLIGWYDVGAYGGYDGHLHFMAEPGFHNDEEDGPTVEWWVDMGSVGENGVEVLVRALSGFGEVFGVPLKKLVLGWRSET